MKFCLSQKEQAGVIHWAFFDATTHGGPQGCEWHIKMPKNSVYIFENYTLLPFKCNKN